jgi:hypothetical protein
MSEASATPSATPLLFNRYRVIEQLGETRLSAVYAAVDERLQRRVLLHLLRKELVGKPHARERFVTVAGESARRSHQALTEVFDSGEAAQRPYMVSEFVSGRSLRSLGLVTPEQALLYMRQICGAVAACQAQRSVAQPAGLYHPPIGSMNVLLVDEGRVKLVETWQVPLADLPGELAHYRPPELSEGLAATPASAVYSLGLLLYELMTGVRPISASDPRATAMAHLHAQIPPLGQTRPQLFMPAVEKVLVRATARFPDRRYADAAAFGAALDELWRSLSATTRPLTPLRPVPVALPTTPAAVATQPAPVATPAPATAAAAQPALPAAPGPLRGLTGRLARPLGIDPAQVRRRNALRGTMGWVIMLVLLVAVVGGSYALVSGMAGRIPGLSLPSQPQVSLPDPPSTGQAGPFDWLAQLLSADEIYIVNINEGLNLRSEPDLATNANILTVVPNGTPVRKLAEPEVHGNVTWLLVDVQLNGQRYEGWMSLKYLTREE